MFHAWGLFVAFALLVSTGYGLLLRRIAPRVVGGVLVVPLGLAGFVAAGQIPTALPGLAPAVMPFTLGLAILGWFAGRRHLSRPQPLALLAAAASFFVLGAPVIASGKATLAGYTVQGDIAVHLLGADALPVHGRNFEDLRPSSYSDKLRTYFELTGYPSGGPVALGVLARAAVIDPAWAFQPLVVLLGACLSLVVLSLLVSASVVPYLAALCAALAVQSALFFAFIQTGQIKEVGAALCIATTAALATLWRRVDVPTWRDALPLAVSSAGALAFVGPVASAWIAPILVAVAFKAQPWRTFVSSVTVVLSGTLLLSPQTVATALDYLNVAGAVLTNATDTGNLLRPLSLGQVAGVWLRGEWRLEPVGTAYLLTNAAISVVAVLVVMGTIDSMRRRTSSGLIAALVVVVSGFLLTRGSAYADAKVLAITSPWVSLLACLGVWSLVRADRRLEGALLLGSYLGFVLASNVAGYRDANLAPRDRLAELAQLGEGLAGRGPTLVPDWDETAYHFLRHAEPEGPNEPYSPRRALANTRKSGLLGKRGKTLAPVGAYGEGTDVDLYGERYIEQFETIVLRRRPTVSRPPSSFRRTSRGHYYDTWSADKVLRRSLVAHLPVGQLGNPVAIPDCTLVRRLAALSGEKGRLLAAIRIPPLRTPILPGPHSTGWEPVGDATRNLRPVGPGSLARVVSTSTPTAFNLWVEGSFGRAVDVLVDGRRVGTVANHLDFPGQDQFVGTVALDRGTHLVRIASGGGNLAPGQDGYVRRLGAVTLVSGPEWGRVTEVPTSKWRSLCGVPVDWIDGHRR